MTTAAPDFGLTLGDREFARFRELIYREAGIALTDAKRALLVGRLSRRMRELGLADFAVYLARVESDDTELVRLLDAICTNETHFFREPRQLEQLAGPVCDAWLADADAGKRPRHVRVWSAACSSGEEPYSIAMLLHDRLGRLGWKIEILASDLSTRALARGRAAVWPLERTQHVPERFLKTYLLRGVGQEAGNARIVPVLRDMVRFERINLLGAPLAAHGAFDVIFCRNVLIYFDAASREHTVAGLLRHLAPGGHLFLGHAESLTGARHRLEPVMPAVYRVPMNGRGA